MEMTCPMRTCRGSLETVRLKYLYLVKMYLLILYNIETFSLSFSVWGEGGGMSRESIHANFPAFYPEIHNELSVMIFLQNLSCLLVIVMLYLLTQFPSFPFPPLKRNISFWIFTQVLDLVMMSTAMDMVQMMA